MLDRFFRWLVGLFGQKALDWAYPEAAKQRDVLIAARKAQAVTDAQTRADVAVIEDRVIAREKEIAADQVAVKQNTADIAQGRTDLADKLKQVDDAQSIEEVLNIK